MESMSQTSLNYLTVTKPYIQCIYTQEQSDQKTIKPKYTLEIPQICLIQAPNREEFNQSEVGRKFFYQSCSTSDIITIQVYEDSIVQHLWAIGVIFVFCAMVIGVMMIWRRDKIQIIERLVEEINKVRSKRKERVEFVEERIDH